MGCKEAALLRIWHNFSVLCGKNSDYEDADISKLYGSVSPHSLRCPVKVIPQYCIAHPTVMISNMCFSNAGTPEEEEEFFLELTGNKRIIPITKEGESDEAHDEILSLNLYRYLDTIKFIVCLRNVFVLKKFYEKRLIQCKVPKENDCAPK